ncbi:putative F-box-like domain superfamily protein [Helianthus annuus]|nr:putative F-box-like domain superfamily protein [Helianthus annuus]
MEKLGFAMIVDEIFTRLPAKAIGCLKCVCKDFRQELSTHLFEMMHSCRVGNSLHKKYIPLQDMSIVVDDVIDFLRGANFGGRGYSWSSGIYSGKTIYFVCSKNWYPALGRYIVAFDVISETFRSLRFPESLEVSPWRGEFLSIAKKLHFIVVERSPELSVGLFKVEDEAFIKMFSINNLQIIGYVESFHWSNIFQNNKWLIKNIWSGAIEANLSNEVFNYVQHVDSYIGAKRALFIETTVSLID